MDDLGNIVYVLAVIGYMIYRVFAGKKTESKDLDPSQKKGRSIEDIIQELVDPKQTEKSNGPIETSEQAEHKGHIHDPEPFLTFDAPKKQDMAARMSSSTRASQKGIANKMYRKKTEKVAYVNPVVDEWSNGVDLRKAIIYQTILETPYLR